MKKKDPPKPAPEASCRFTIYLTKETLARWHEAAKGDGRSTGSWIKWLAEKEMSR